MSKQKYTICCFFPRRFKMKQAEVPAEIKSLFENYSENGVMNIENLHKFLQEVQGEHNITLEKTDSLLDSFMHQHKNIHISHDKNLTLQQFFRYLLSEINSPLPHTPTVHHDMNAPLSHYFIYTGHNSYLTGNQISSKCSDLPIIESLKRGVRVIELDMWPNRKKDNVDILHGGTWTAPVGLLKCLKAIREYAFVASDYPVILTLEDHLTPDLQAKVAQMVTETFGDVLVHSTPESLEHFPCPESLKKRIVISTRPPKTYPATKITVKEDHDGTIKVNKSSEEFVWGKKIPFSIERLDSKDKESCKDEDDHQDETIPSLQINAPPDYKHLIAIRNEKMKGGIKAWLRVSSMNAHRVSLNEEKLEKAVLTHGTDIVRFNQRNLMKVYPKGTRIDSSNYNPLIGWMHGAQMVAFNMQKHGRSLWLMQGMFRANGGCGYVKKPDCLLNVGSNNEVFDPRRRLPVKKTLKVTVYMGEGWNLDFHRTYFDLCSPPDFYVKIGIAGVRADHSIMKRTKTIQENCMPEWNEEFEFPLTVPELALLRVEVHEFDLSGKDGFRGQTCRPISELKTGVRAVPLHDYKGVKYNSVKLLMHFGFI